MKTNQLEYSILTAFAALGLATSVSLAASDIHFGPTGSEASAANNDGTWIQMWNGASVSPITFDTANPPPSGDTAGSVYLQGNWTGAGQDDYTMVSPGTWWGNVHFDGSQYSSIEFDFKYDTNSTISPANSAHQEICFELGYSRATVSNLNLTIGSSPLADGNWHHVSVYVPATMSGIGNADGVSFYQWNPGSLGTMNFWIANVVLVARIVPVAPPTVSVPVPAKPGLNVFASTEGNSFYDRQEAELIQNSGLSWVGHATTGNSVTYSFTITGYPNSVNCEAYMFLVPNPAANDSAPDWNETNCAIVYLQGNANSATAHFQYKINEDHQQAMYSGGSETRSTASVTNNFYYSAAPGSMPGGAVTNEVSPGVFNITNESGNLASVTNTGVLGTWTLKFTSDTSGTLIAPNGNSTNFVIPSYNTGLFGETQTPAFNIYLGMQANQADAMNQAVVYSDFGVTGVGTPHSETFVGQSVLNTNIWSTSVSGGPKGVLIVPSGSLWLKWNLPDTGFSARTASTLTHDPFSWNSPAGPLVPLYAFDSQLILSSDLPGGNEAFFRLTQPVFTQLQVLLPGETNAPNTLTGKVGSYAGTASAGTTTVNFTVNAVDSTWHIISSVSDNLSFTSSDGSALFNSTTAQLVNGTAQGTVIFYTAGSQTVMATDTTTNTIPMATSSPVTVQ